MALTHSRTQYSEEYHSFVNGQNTTQEELTYLLLGGICQNDKRVFGKNYDSSDIRKSIVSSISIKVMEPVLSHKLRQNLVQLKWVMDYLPFVLI